MKKMNSRELLEQLQSDTRTLMVATRNLLQKDPELLVTRPAEGKWSVAQVIEHLNAYGRYYLFAIDDAMKNPQPATTDYSPGWLGNYFTNMMLPNKGKVVNKMGAMKGYRPVSELDSFKVLNEFVAQEEKLLRQLKLAEQVDIGKSRVPVSIAKFIKLKLGDTFRFLIAHHQRHFVQIENTLKLIA